MTAIDGLNANLRARGERPLADFEEALTALAVLAQANGDTDTSDVLCHLIALRIHGSVSEFADCVRAFRPTTDE